jgi:uncharacterized phage protein (TIGR01671 family)
MTREIKFRSWAGEEMSSGYTLDAISEYGRDWFIESQSIMQFTGLHDKNGVEIYEGDILFVNGWEEYKNCKPKPKKEEVQGVYVVRLEIGHWGLATEWEHIKGYECSTHIMGDTEGNAEHLEVIGNIYQNKDLLNI